MISHRDVREALELAAVEPGGLDRLEAGDTPEAALVVGHLAGCAACLEELARLRRAEAILRPIVAELPDPTLRERTLQLVRAAGVPRGQQGDAVAGPAAVTGPGVAAGAAPGPHGAPAAAPAAGASGPDRPTSSAGASHRRVPTPAWLGALAAVLVVGFVGGTLAAGSGASGGNGDPGTALASVTREAAALVAAGDAREIALSGDPGASGTMILSPSADRIVVAAAGLAAPAAGEEYRCWVEVDGRRTELGTMWWAGEVAWWAGDVALPAKLPPGVVYGVSRVVDGTTPGTTVLSGEL